MAITICKILSSPIHLEGVQMRKWLILNTALVCTCIFSVSMTNAQTTTKVKGSDVVINGDSFFALSGQIKTDLENLARADGYIGSNESFRNAAVSGAVLSGIANQYSNTNPKPVFVIMDGGGNNVLLTTCSTPPTVDCEAIKTAIADVQPLLDKMAAGGTKKVLWMRYAEPGSNQASVIKPKLDLLMTEVEKICSKSTKPKVIWYDLRPIWGNKGIDGTYSSDGLHPTASGAQATADALWKAIKDSSFFDTNTTSISSGHLSNIDKSFQSTFLHQIVSNNNLTLSLFLAQPGEVTMRITTFSGRTVVAAAKQEQKTGLQTVQFPLGAIASGLYCLDIRAGRFSERTPLVMP
jgi:lysophospholipase L1-like esterase